MCVCVSWQSSNQRELLARIGYTSAVKFELKIQKGSSSPKPNDKDGVFLRVAKARTTRKAWGATKHAAVSGKREITWTDTISLQTHIVRKTDGTWAHKDAYFFLCEVRRLRELRRAHIGFCRAPNFLCVWQNITGKIGEFVTLATGKTNLSNYISQPANAWSEMVSVQLDRPPEPGGADEKEAGGSQLKEKKRVKIEMQVRYKLVKMNHRRLTLVDDKNEVDAARSKTAEVNGEDYIVNSESSESEEISEAVQDEDDDEDTIDDLGDDKTSKSTSKGSTTSTTTTATATPAPAAATTATTGSKLASTVAAASTLTATASTSKSVRFV
jgi:hypothetical protein